MKSELLEIEIVEEEQREINIIANISCKHSNMPSNGHRREN